MKKILSVFLIITSILSIFSISYAEDTGKLVCSNITYVDGSGNTVTQLVTEPMTAKIEVTNNTDSAVSPVLMVCSYENGKLNGVWYKAAEEEIPVGETSEVKVDFTPVTTANTEIKATVIDSLISLNAPMATSKMLNNTTDVDALMINGQRIADYSNDVDEYLVKVDGNKADALVEVTDGGTKVEISQVETLPGVADILLTSADGTERNIEVTLYNDDKQLYSLTGLGYEIDGVKYEIADFDPDTTKYVVELPDNTFYATVVPEVLPIADTKVHVTDRNLLSEGGKVAEDVPSYFLGSTYIHRGTREAYNNLIPIKNEKTTATIKVSALGENKEYTVDFVAKQPRLTHFALGDGNFPIEDEKPYFVSGAAANNDNGTAVGGDRNTWTLGGIPKDLVGASMISLYSVNGQRNTPNWQRTSGNENTKWCEFKADTDGTVYLVSGSIDGDFYTKGTGGWELATNVTGAANKLIKANGIDMTIYENLSGVYCFYACQWTGDMLKVPYSAAQIKNASLISGDVSRIGVTYKKTFKAGDLVEIYHPRKSPAAISAEAFIVWDLPQE